MALKVGDLYVSLTANTQKLQGQLNSASKQVEKFGRQLKGLGKDASEMSNMVVAAVGVAFAAASSKDADVKQRVDEAKAQATALAVEVARVAMPLLQQMTDTVGRLVTVFRSLSPEQKAMLTTFLQGAALVSALGVAAVKLEPAFKLAGTAITFAGTAMSAFGSAVVWVQGALASLGIGFLPLLALIASFVFIAGFVRQAWAENLGGIQEKFAAVWGWISEKATVVGDFLGEIATTVGTTFQKAFAFVADKFASFLKTLIEGAAVAARALGMDELFDVNGMEKAALQFVNSAPGAMMSAAETLRAGAVDGVKAIASGVGTALEFSGQGLSKIAGDIKEKLAAALKGILPESAKVELSAEAKKDEKEKKAAPVKVDYGRLRTDKMEASFVALAGVGGNLRDSLEMAGALNVPKELEQFSGDALKSVKGIEDVRDLLHKLGASAGETEKYLGAWERWQEEQKKNAAYIERLRADRTPQSAQQFLAGGTFGESARMAGVKTGIPDWLEKFDGSRLKTLSDFEDLEDALAQVRELNPVVKEFFEKSKETFLGGIEQAKRQAEEQANARNQAVSGFRDQVIGSMGKVGGIIQAATGPLAQALGPIGALLGIVLELVSGSKGFENLISALDGILQGLADAVGQVFEPVSVLVNALQPIVAAAGALVAQVLPLVTAVLEPLLPVFVMLGAVLMALSPLLAFVVRVVEVALIPVLAVLEGVMRSLFGALQTVAVIVLGVVVGVVNVWNGIVSAIQAVLTWISGFEIAGQRPFAFLAEWATSLEAAKGPAAQYQQQLNDAMAMTYESAMTQAKAFGALDEATNKLAGSMTNAASGFKVDLARFNATGVGATPGAPVEATGGGYYGDTYVTIVSNDPEAIWSKMETVRRRKSFQTGRGPLGGLPAFGS